MKTLLRAAAALLILLVPALAALQSTQGADEDPVGDFKRYFRKYKDTPTRVEAVLSLSGCESPGVVEVLAPLFSEAEPEVGIAAARVLGGFKTRPPVDQLVLTLSTSGDPAVKQGLLRALAQAHYENVKDGILPLLQDRSWEVRRRAVQALAATGEPGVAELLVPLCQESEVAVRCAAIEGLVQLKSELVLAPARTDLSDDSWQVRATAIAALGRVRHTDSVGPLIERMALEEGRLREDIGVALKNLTGRDLGTRVDAWQQFWKTVQGRYQIPTDEELAKLRAVQAERAAEYQKVQNTVAYHGVETPSQSLVFVIDVSGSMEQDVVDKARFAGQEFPSWKRIDVIKTELIRTLRTLDANTRFNVIAFATDVMPWKKGPVKANPLNKSSAEAWVSRLEAIGGSSKEDLASVGLVASANLEGGKTNSYGALMTALGAVEGKESRDYEVDVDTIFFLSDGRPSHGRFVEPDDVLREIRAANELRKVTIHTITLGEFEKDFMRRLAEENGGTFVDLGH